MSVCVIWPMVADETMQQFFVLALVHDSAMTAGVIICLCWCCCDSLCSCVLQAPRCSAWSSCCHSLEAWPACTEAAPRG